MFQEATIVYFDPFYFKNGNVAKPKYFIVLKRFNEQQLLASLPTRKDAIPNAHATEAGCIDLPEINLNCFVISPLQPATECGKYFDFATHVYGHQLDDYSIARLSEIYPNEGTDYIVWGQLKKSIYTDLLACLRNSRSVKNKYRRLL
jgi:hypothetical protein